MQVCKWPLVLHGVVVARTGGSGCPLCLLLLAAISNTLTKMALRVAMRNRKSYRRRVMRGIVLQQFTTASC